MCYLGFGEYLGLEFSIMGFVSWLGRLAHEYWLDNSRRKIIAI